MRSRPAGRRLRDFAAPDGELGYFSKQFDVYDREGEPCRDGCAGTVKRIVQGGRSTFLLPVRASAEVRAAAVDANRLSALGERHAGASPMGSRRFFI